MQPLVLWGFGMGAGVVGGGATQFAWVAVSAAWTSFGTAFHSPVELLGQFVADKWE